MMMSFPFINQSARFALTKGSDAIVIFRLSLRKDTKFGLCLERIVDDAQGGIAKVMQRLSSGGIRGVVIGKNNNFLVCQSTYREGNWFRGLFRTDLNHLIVFVKIRIVNKFKKKRLRTYHRHL